MGRSSINEVELLKDPWPTEHTFYGENKDSFLEAENKEDKYSRLRDLGLYIYSVLGCIVVS